MGPRAETSAALLSSSGAPAIPQRFHQDDSGAAAVEYAILIACIGLAILGGLILLREPIQAAWDLAAELLEATPT
jgi:Flp pilus assembly pilin Flp